MKAIDWMRLDVETRVKLIQEYNLIKTGSTDVRGGVVISDGYTDADLERVVYPEVNITTNGTKQNGTAIDKGNGSQEKKRAYKRKTISIPSK